MNTRLHAHSFLIGSFMMYTDDRFLARRAADVLSLEDRWLNAGTVLIDGMVVRWRNLAVSTSASRPA